MPQSFGIQFKQKRMFFDRVAVRAQIGKQKAAFLSRAGAFIQRRARSSMRRRKRASAPGTPPSAHSTDAVRSLKNIWFAFDPQRESVVIGPLLLHGSGGSVPGLHEHGGTRPVVERRIRGRWVPERMIRNPAAMQHAPRRIRQARYPARPFMGPAGDAEMKNPKLWFSNSRKAA